MELKNRDEKNRAVKDLRVANYVHKITYMYQIIDIVKRRHKFVPMSIRVYNFEEL